MGGRVVLRLRLFVSGLLVLLTCGSVAILPATAQALPERLSSTAFSADGVSVGAQKYVLSNGNKVECESSSSTSEETAPPRAGLFHIVFKGCVGEVSGIKAKCTGLGDTSTGEVLVLGEYHLVYDTGEPELGVAVLFLVNPTHFTCASLFLNVVEGEEVCLVKEPYVEKTLHQLVCASKGGKQSDTWLNDSGETITPKLSVTEGENSRPEGAWELELLVLWLEAGGNAHTKIVMS
jgi:hypothetical protein